MARDVGATILTYNLKIASSVNFKAAARKSENKRIHPKNSFSQYVVNISLVNTKTQHILIALGPNVYHGCILGVSWLSSKMDDLDIFFDVMGVDFNMKIGNFRL